LNSGVLRIGGSDGPDSIVVHRRVLLTGGGLGGTITASDVISIDGLSQSFATGKVQRIEILAGDGDDVVRLDTERDGGFGAFPITLPTVIHGGFGKDTIYGGTGNDVIFGEDGDDT